MAHTKDGMNCVAMHDPVGRRGLWFKKISDDVLSICAGREGDDAAAIITVGDTITREQLASLVECFEAAQYVYDELRADVFVTGSRQNARGEWIADDPTEEIP